MFSLEHRTFLICTLSVVGDPSPSRLVDDLDDGFHLEQALIKRVIAVGGDSVQIKDGSLFVNGQEQFEDYTFEVRGRLFFWGSCHAHADPASWLRPLLRWSSSRCIMHTCINTCLLLSFVVERSKPAIELNVAVE